MAEITPREMANVFRRAADRPALEKIVELTLRTQTPTAETGVRNCFDRQTDIDGEPWPPLQHPRPGEADIGRALLDKGLLRASVACTSEGDTLTLQTNRIGARLLHFGGVVVPVNAQYLCIPATLDAKRAGSPRDFPGALTPIINKARTGGVLIGTAGVDVKPKRIESPMVQVQYYMTKKVTIPPRRFCGFPAYVVTEILLETRDSMYEFIAWG